VLDPSSDTVSADLADRALPDRAEQRADVADVAIR
jgi:hypothetical protein